MVPRQRPARDARVRSAERRQWLKRERCWGWPDCRCGREWPQFAESALEGLSADELFDREAMGYVYLACMAAHCPDRETRRYAHRQLSRRVFDRQRRVGVG